MSVEEVTKEGEKLGFTFFSHSVESDTYMYGNIANGVILYFSIDSDYGVYRKNIDMPEVSVYNTDINKLLDKHKNLYLTAVGIDFEEQIVSVIEKHGAIFFYNQEYMGQIQINYNNGKAQVQYGLLKLGIVPTEVSGYAPKI